VTELQISIDAGLLASASKRAQRDGSTVEEVLTRFLSAYASHEEASTKGIAAFIEWARRSESGSPQGGRTWTRDEIHDRRAG
jgi:hypothetical protein